MNSAMLPLVVLLCVGLPSLPPALAQQPRKWIPSYAGPYIVAVSRAFMCPDTSAYDRGLDISMRVSHWNPRKPNELQRASGNASCAQNVTDAEWVNMSLDKRSNNQWKPNAFIFNFPKGACSTLRKLFPDAMNMIFGESKGACVMARGNYTFDRTVNWLPPDVPVLPYGEYRLNMRFGPQGSSRPLFCFLFEWTAIPRA